MGKACRSRRRGGGGHQYQASHSLDPQQHQSLEIGRALVTRSHPCMPILWGHTAPFLLLFSLQGSAKRVAPSLLAYLRRCGVAQHQCHQQKVRPRYDLLRAQQWHFLSDYQAFNLVRPQTDSCCLCISQADTAEPGRRTWCQDEGCGDIQGGASAHRCYYLCISLFLFIPTTPQDLHRGGT
jgi:hypothetical protein